MRTNAMKTIVAATSIALAIAMTSSVNAQRQDIPGRYTMHKADDGFIRLDTQTGEASLCRKAERGWSCAPMEDSAERMRKQIAELEQQNRALSREIATMRDELATLGRRPGRETHPDHYDDRPGGRSQFRLPSEQDVDRALDYFERMLKKFQDRLNRLERSTPPAPKGAEPAPGQPPAKAPVAPKKET